jgi:dCMP deaminase
MIERASRTEAFLFVAQQLSRLSYCQRRRVGCVLTDDFNRIVSLGYNGVPSHMPHECEKSCPRQDFGPGERLDMCMAIHAEANALLHCPDTKRVAACYTWGATPCWECAKMLCNTSVKRVFSSSSYGSTADVQVINLFRAKGISLTIVQFDEVVQKRGNEPPHDFKITELVR